MDNKNKQNYKVLDNGVIMLTTANNTLMHKCLYCETWFTPLRRFMQKYCNDSCRVMSCRKRKRDMFGLTGGNFKDRNSTTNTELFNIVAALKGELDELKDNSHDEYRKLKERIKNSQTSLKDDLFNSTTKIESTLIQNTLESKLDAQSVTNSLNQLKKLQNWNIALSIIMPLVAPFIGNKLQTIFNPDKPFENMESFYEKINPLLEKAPKELKDTIYTTMSSYFENAQS